MHIRKHANKNEYIRAGNIWVRNFAKKSVKPFSVDHMFEKSDYERLIANETKNDNQARISDEPIILPNIVIVSDGYNFKTRHKLLTKMPSYVSVLAVNRALKNWTLFSTDESQRKTINAYVVNNPYEECLSCLPSQYYPVCVASSRTNYKFLEKYKGNMYLYEPTPENKFGLKKPQQYHIDDYRNPICAAIGLAYQFKVERLMLMCCDDSFDKEQDFSVQLKNELWTYPQHLRSQEIIDANLYWLTHQEEHDVQVSDWSDGAEYTNASYISNEEEAIDFFKD
jgi:hypothetical protein